MAKTVQLSEDAYAGLAAAKQAGESFSDTVRRLLCERRDPHRLLGLRPRPDFDLDDVRARMAAADLERLRGGA